ncbi:MAG: non-hydrolyzing UDP-N-acetylglucosamine 2-epimerase [bacterium]
MCNIIGARPQFIKQATISRVVKNRDDIEEIIIHTGQHYDKNMSEQFFRELEIPEPEYNLGIGSGPHGLQTGKMLQKIEEVLIQEYPDCVLVYGDTNSTIAGALAAAKLHIPVAHVEAGLRSFNRKMPEEINRIGTDVISDILFAPTQTAMDHLKKEGLSNRSFFSGDVMYDSVLFYANKLKNSITNHNYSDFYLATIHRPANTDNIENFKSIMKAFSTFDKQIIFPAHPRTKNIIKNIVIPENVKIINPVGYLNILEMVMAADLVFTDSGGLQKECFFLKKRCITLREETEWIETLENNCNVLVGADYQKIINAEKMESGEFEIVNKFGDGNAAKVIINHFNNY